MSDGPFVRHSFAPGKESRQYYTSSRCGRHERLLTACCCAALTQRMRYERGMGAGSEPFIAFIKRTNQLAVKSVLRMRRVQEGDQITDVAGLQRRPWNAELLDAVDHLGTVLPQCGCEGSRGVGVPDGSQLGSKMRAVRFCSVTSRASAWRWWFWRSQLGPAAEFHSASRSVHAIKRHIQDSAKFSGSTSGQG